MAKLLCCSISPGFVIEINVVLIGLGIIFLVDLYNHIYLRSSTLSELDMTIGLLGLSARISWIRGICLFVYLLFAILGIRMSKHPSIIKFAGYMLAGSTLLLFTICVAVSRYLYSSSLRYYTNMMLHTLWMKAQIEMMEELFDCCGIHGSIDYIIANRTWSMAACCNLPDCDGCQDMFHDYMKNIEMEIARDNFALFLIIAIALALMILYYKYAPLTEDPYVPEYMEEKDE
ncbi:uncharacterized protein LOC6559925 [Drosophila grimshawi]|uniref:GH20419 n=1 Tax=Drosophila grimshawi TaxID=7222 RepID=B4J9T2_DROGR|nr:uncharacterized protein LOC6559925 [Drosophila grimshawi]EDW01496.1 GH20419 [Drosophila grimshawi]